MTPEAALRGVPGTLSPHRALEPLRTGRSLRPRRHRARARRGVPRRLLQVVLLGGASMLLATPALRLICWLVLLAAGEQPGPYTPWARPLP